MSSSQVARRRARVSCCALLCVAVWHFTAKHHLVTADGGVAALLQQAPQLPMYDLNAAWQAALNQGPTPVQSWPQPRPFPTTALSSLRVTREAAQIYVVAVPAGVWNLVGNITVASGQLLWFQGQGGFPTFGTEPSFAPLSTWVLGNNSTASITVQPGGVLYLRNLTLIGPQLGPLETPLSWVPTFVDMPVDPWAAALAMESLAWVLDACSKLEERQANVCNMLLRDSDVPWPSVELEPGWMVLYRGQATLGNVSLDLSYWSCSYPPPALYSGASGTSVSPGGRPNAPPVSPAIWNATVIPLTPAGFPLGPLAPVPKDGSGRQLACVARRVANQDQLARAVVELQAMSNQYVVVTIGSNMTLNDTNNNGWPTSELALRIYRNVTILGRHVLTTRTTEIDMGLTLRNIFYVETGAGYMRWQQLTLTNMPCGNRLFFPANTLVVMMWALAWDRSMDDRNYVDVRNCTLVMPLDNFNYTSYWVGIQASPIPSVRALASWQTNLAFSGSLEVSNDSHTLFIQRRWGRGIQWTNTSLTDLPVVAPLRYNSRGCGLQRLVPNQPYFPYTQITPVFTGGELLEFLQNPVTPVVMLLDNVTFSGNDSQVSLVQRYVRDPGATAIPLDQRANATWVDVAEANLTRPAHVNVTRGPVTVLGWLWGDTVLDFNNSADLVSLQLQAGGTNQQPLNFGRLVIMGLGPANPTQRAGDLTNLTTNLWLLDFDRSQDLVSLQDVTLLTAPAELSKLQSIVNGTGGFGAGPVAGSLVAPDAGFFGTAGQFQSSWAAAKVRTSTPGQRLELSSVNYNGIQASDLVLTSALDPALASQLTVTPFVQGLTLPDGSSGPVPFTGTGVGPLAPTPTPTPGGEGGGGFQPWMIAVLVVACVAALMVAGFMVWWVRRVRRHAKAEAEVAAKYQYPGGGGGMVDGLYPAPPDGGSTTPDMETGSQVAARSQCDPSIASHRHSSVRTSLSRGTGDLLSPFPSSLLPPPTSRSEITPVGSESTAPDAEIRQLVSLQRERAQARSGSSTKTSGQGQELEGVTLDSVLGQGSFGVVYLGRWRGMRVAVKTIIFHDTGPAARRARQRAVNEAAINTLLSHDCICNMYAYDLRPMAPTGLPDDRFSSNYRLYIIQEYCDAGSLSEAIDGGAFMDQGRRNEVAILEVALQIAMGLEYIHSNNVIHGDLSSGNVMLRTAPDTRLGFQAKLCDFGLGHFLEGPEQSHVSNARQGTPFYMAPEVLAHGIISREADVFSLGVILWELYNAVQPPWRDPAVVERARKQIADARQRTPTIEGMDSSQSGRTIESTTSSFNIVDPLPFRPILSLSGNSSSGMSCPLPPECPQAFVDMVSSCIHPIPKVRPRMSDVVGVLRRLLNHVLATEAGQLIFHRDVGGSSTAPPPHARARTISWGSVAARTRQQEHPSTITAGHILRPVQSALLSGTYTIQETHPSIALEPAAPSPSTTTLDNVLPHHTPLHTAIGPLEAGATSLPPGGGAPGSVQGGVAAGPQGAGVVQGGAGVPKAGGLPSRLTAARSSSCPANSVGLESGADSPLAQNRTAQFCTAPPRLTLFSEPGSTYGSQPQPPPQQQQDQQALQQHIIETHFQSSQNSSSQRHAGAYGTMDTSNLFDSVDLPSTGLKFFG